MGITASHVLSMTTPDDPAYENQPKHWNSVHAVTLNAVGSEISGAFGNGGGVSFGLSADGKLTAAAPAGVPSPVHVSAGTTESDLGTIVFVDSNGLGFGLSGSTVTGSYSQSTHAHPYRNSTDAVGLNTAQTNVTWTVNSSGISLNAAGYAGVGESVGTVAGTDLALTVNTDGVSILYPKWLTTARGSTDAIGLNTAQTNVTWTVNSSGLSINAGGYAGTGFTSTTTAGTQVKATHGTDGLSMAVPAFLTTSVAQTNQSAIKAFGVSNTGATAGNTGVSTGVDWVLAGSNLLTLSQSTAGGGPNTVWIQHPAWLTTARGSTDAVGLNTAQTNVTWTVNSSGLSFNAGGYAGTTSGFAGANISGSMTHNTVGLNLSLSVPATSSLVGTSGMSVSSNGSTISVQPVPMSQWSLGGAEISQAGTAQGNSLVSIQPFFLNWPVAFSNFRFAASLDVATAANNSSAYADVSVSGVVYTRNASTLSSLFSFSNSLTQSWSSNATSSVTGVAAITATCVATTLTPGDYWIAVHVSTANSATGGANTTALANTVSMILHGAHHVDSNANLMKQWGAATNNSQGLISGQGILSTGATLATIAFSDYVATGTRGALAGLYFGLRNATFQG